MNNHYCRTKTIKQISDIRIWLKMAHPLSQHFPFRWSWYTGNGSCANGTRLYQQSSVGWRHSQHYSGFLRRQWFNHLDVPMLRRKYLMLLVNSISAMRLRTHLIINKESIVLIWSFGMYVWKALYGDAGYTYVEVVIKTSHALFMGVAEICISGAWNDSHVA